jgi:hypothetical protein
MVPERVVSVGALGSSFEVDKAIRLVAAFKDAPQDPRALWNAGRSKLNDSVFRADIDCQAWGGPVFRSRMEALVWGPVVPRTQPPTHANPDTRPAEGRARRCLGALRETSMRHDPRAELAHPPFVGGIGV